MRTVSDFPHTIVETPHEWIKLSDGTRLAARIWRPTGAEEQPVPAILEYIPYRKSDAMAISDSARYRYLAGHGYACLRVDIRGSGDSEGLLTDEYSDEELNDGFELVEWIANQPWCNGKVGLTGISWGGFNALQIAAMRPPALAAVISACSTDDRYRDDVHYMGECVLASDMLSWATTFLAMNAQPPNPNSTGDAWQEMHQHRLGNLVHFIEPWLTHQERNDYWRHGSVCENYDAINCPVMLVGGWADGYTNSIFRLLDNLSVPTRALIGPWAHNWPDSAYPKPQIDYLKETLRWWDKWLKGQDTDVMDDPQLRCFIKTNIDGEWRGIDWKNRQREELRYAVGNNRLVRKSQQSTDVVLPNLLHGETAGDWCPFGLPGQLPEDQMPDDDRCLALLSDPHKEPITFLGNAILNINTTASAGQLVARFCDLAPDSSSTLIARGVQKLVQPGTVSITLEAMGYRLEPDHRLGLYLSCSYWPMIWPSSDLNPIEVTAGELVLPVDTESTPLAQPFGEPEQADSIAYTVLERPAYNRAENVDEDIYERVITSDSGKVEVDGFTSRSQSKDTYTIHKDDPLSASATCERTLLAAFDDTEVTTHVISKMTCDADNFYVETDFKSERAGKLAHEQQFRFSVPRMC